MKKIFLNPVIFFAVLAFNLFIVGDALAECVDEVAPDENLSRIMPVAATASGYWNGNVAANAIDGNCLTMWNSGGFATQWIEIDLGESYQLKELRLLPSQFPNGAIALKIFAGLTPNPAKLVYEFSGNGENLKWNNINFANPINDVRYVRVINEKSPSWIGWFEINAYYSNPEVIGYFDGITADNLLWGWTCDPGNYSSPLEVSFYDGLAQDGKLIGNVIANVTREAAVGNLCGGQTAHGFRWPLPAAYLDGKIHLIYAYAKNISSGKLVLLNNQKAAYYAKSIEIFAGIAPFGSDVPTQADKSRELSEYINRVSDNFTGVEPHINHGLVKESVDAAHARGFKVMTHCAFLNDCLEMARIGVDIIAFDEFKVRFDTLPANDPAKGQGLGGQEFNVWKLKLKQANPSAQVGIVEAYTKNYLDFYNEGANPDFIGLEQYVNKNGDTIYPSYGDFMNQAASKFPDAKIHIWSNQVSAAEIYKNKTDLLIYFDIDNHILRLDNNYPALKLADVENKIAPYCANRCGTSGAKQCFAAGYQVCGSYDSDSCLEWGAVVNCPTGQTCEAGICKSTQTCVAKTCTSLGNYQCGDWSNDCGKTINCGTCAAGKACNNSGQCVASSGSPSPEASANQGGGSPAPEASDDQAGDSVQQKLTRAEILQKIAEIKKLLIQLIIQLIAELQKQLAAMSKNN